MDASKRERIILFGVVPVVAAIVGAVVTVVVGHLTGGGGNTNDVMLEIVKSSNLTFEQKQALLEIADQNAARFYTWLSSIGTIFVFIIVFFRASIAETIEAMIDRS